MAQIADRRDIDFVLFEQFDVEGLCEKEKFAEYNRKTIDLIINEATSLAIKEILPLQPIADTVGMQFNGGVVTAPPEFQRVYKIYCEGEWLGMADDPQWGGQGMPKTVSYAANEYFYGACNGFMLMNMLTHGCGKMIETYGTDEQKKQCLKQLYTGEWGGTMLLTEPDAGSDVGALTTTAVKNPDGTYSISGNKIFISSGEHDMTPNIIHPTLARIEGAPAGVGGISLFMVPKFRINPDGSLGEFNDVICTGIEEKMGLHGSPTCSLTLGGKGACIGTLIGEENKGMSHMFHMMNEARQVVGFQGFATMTPSYANAVNYAKERIQFRGLADPPDAPGVAIINHPDVRRQLMNMKAYTEGTRSLNYYLAYLIDINATTDDAELIAKNKALIEILTPIIKGYGTDKTLEVTSHGVQVYGGYGYIQEFPQEQLMRDCRIYMIYEGTNGIQSLDLAGRKLGMKKGKPFMDFLGEIKKTIDMAKGIAGIEGLVDKTQAALDKFQEISLDFAGKMRSDTAKAFCFTHPFMEVTGDLVMAWMLLWRAAVAAPKIAAGGKDADFYQGQVVTAKFFINTIIPITMGKMEAIAALDGAAVEMPEGGFAAS